MLNILQKNIFLNSATRFRWQQPPNGMPNSQDWALGDIHIGASCPKNCNGHGFCFNQVCDCDDGYQGTDCSILTDDKAKVFSMIVNRFN